MNTAQHWMNKKLLSAVENLYDFLCSSKVPPLLCNGSKLLRSAGSWECWDCTLCHRGIHQSWLAKQKVDCCCIRKAGIELSHVKLMGKAFRNTILYMELCYFHKLPKAKLLSWIIHWGQSELFSSLRMDFWLPSRMHNLQLWHSMVWDCIDALQPLCSLVNFARTVLTAMRPTVFSSSLADLIF